MQGRSKFVHKLSMALFLVKKKMHRKFSLFEIHVTIKMYVAVFFCLFHDRSSHLNPAVRCASRQGETTAVHSLRYANVIHLRAGQYLNDGVEIIRMEDLCNRMTVLGFTWKCR